MSDVIIGEIHTTRLQRDAIHVAIAPVEAHQILRPGQHVGFMYKDNTELVGVCSNPVGIVDPYLERSVHPGDRFWLFLYPQTVTSLRHDWTHPAFPAVKATTPARDHHEQWIKNYAEDLGLSYRDLMNGAASWVANGSYLSRGGLLESISTSEEFWEHYQALQDEVIPDYKKRSFFTCAC